MPAAPYLGPHRRPRSRGLLSRQRPPSREAQASVQPRGDRGESLGGSRFLVCVCVWFAAGLLTRKQAAWVSWVSWGLGCAWSIRGRWTSVVVGAGRLLPQPALLAGAVARGGGCAPWAAGGSLFIPHEMRQARQLLPRRGWVSVEWRQLGTWACGQPSAVGSRDPRLARRPQEPDMTWVCWGDTLSG